jgi:hypothetical protein
MIQINIYEAKARLSELVERAEKGERVVIARAGVPKVVLTLMNEAEPKLPRVFGGGGPAFGHAGDQLDDFTSEEMAALFDSGALE